MFHSVFQIFKIGIGPSSSHTMGPMTAAMEFRARVKEAAGQPKSDLKPPLHLVCRLMGSLAFTGKGHASDRAVCLGLLGFEPDNAEPEPTEAQLAVLAERKSLELPGVGFVAFDPEADIEFDMVETDLAHPNTLSFELMNPDGLVLLKETYCSIGGGFVVTESEAKNGALCALPKEESGVPYHFNSMSELLALCAKAKLSIAEITRRNELALQDKDAFEGQLTRLVTTMDRCVERGLHSEGQLPGGLKVERRAAKIFRRLGEEKLSNTTRPHMANDWMCAYAMAVNEENAAGNQVVTAPTNGAAGIIPAVMRFYCEHIESGTVPMEKRHDFLLAAGTVGSIIKQRASISGAEVGCQGEVGSASAMAAAGLCAVLGGSNEQIENAAEIALEHHLGLTCDPIRGLVQVPCIERNAFGAIKAVSAASLALHGDGQHIMPLDNCIEAMRQTGLEMSSKYKETSQGGLAVNLPEC